MGDLFEWIEQVQRVTKPLIYFCTAPLRGWDVDRLIAKQSQI